MTIPTPATAAPKHNLPAQAVPFVGREAELAQLARLLADPKVRLVTILGPGGIGKTHLALEAAAVQLENFAQGVYLISLAPLRAAENIVPTLAQAVGYLFQGGRREPKGQILDYLGAGQMLLLLDSFEHLLEGAGLVSEILQAAAGVKVLATAREPLNLQKEVRFRIAGLDFPDWEMAEKAGSPDWTKAAHHAQDAWQYSAIQLFVQSARRISPGLTLEDADVKHVVRICQLVEGMPLGIVLAAGWVEMLSLHEIAAEVHRSLDLLETEMRDVPARHRSIRAMFESTWGRMRDAECEALMKLSVFRGGFTRDAAQKVTGAGLRTLKTLVNKSLLRRDQATGRYEIHELLRQYAEEQLEASGRAVAARDAHCEYYLVALHQREVDVHGRRGPAALQMVSEAGVDVVTPPAGAVQPLLDPLTGRELEVLRLIAAGLSNREIAERLFIGVSTVKKHINRMYSKLGVKRRTQAIVRARELNLL